MIPVIYKEYTCVVLHICLAPAEIKEAVYRVRSIGRFPGYYYLS